MSDLTQEQRDLILAALDGKQMQRRVLAGPFVDSDNTSELIYAVISGGVVRIKPEPRVLHCVLNAKTGGLQHYSSGGDVLPLLGEHDSYARIEIDSSGNITGKVGL